jgi:hypothetical protein
MSLTKLSLAGNSHFALPRESLVSDIPPGDGKTAILFLQCSLLCSPAGGWIETEAKGDELAEQLGSPFPHTYAVFDNFHFFHGACLPMPAPLYFSRLFSSFKRTDRE